MIEKLDELRELLKSLGKNMNKKVEHDTYQKYSGTVYEPQTISVLPIRKSHEYANKLLRIKLQLVEELLTPKSRILDVGCGNGIHLITLSSKINNGVGLDFSQPFIDYAKKQCQRKRLKNISFELGNAKKMAFDSESFDGVYSLSTLYHVPSVSQVISEISRVLKPNGWTVLDMGNLYSLNTIACLSHPELATPCHIQISEMKRIFENNKLVIKKWRSFQLLPLWSDKPWWLYPLLWPGWKRIMTIEVGGKMLDEIISSLPVIRQLTFRQIFVCKKLG